MNEVESFLMDWTEVYVRNRDILKKEIKSLERKETQLIISCGDKEKQFFILPFIRECSVLDAFLSSDNSRHISLVLLNTSQNLRCVLESWNKLVKYPRLCIIFVNPLSSADKKWIIYPYTHNKVCESDALERGLQALFESVEPITEAGFTEKLISAKV